MLQMFSGLLGGTVEQPPSNARPIVRIKYLFILNNFLLVANPLNGVVEISESYNNAWSQTILSKAVIVNMAVDLCEALGDGARTQVNA